MRKWVNSKRSFAGCNCAASKLVDLLHRQAPPFITGRSYPIPIDKMRQKFQDGINYWEMKTFSRNGYVVSVHKFYSFLNDTLNPTLKRFGEALVQLNTQHIGIDNMTQILAFAEKYTHPFDNDYSITDTDELLSELQRFFGVCSSDITASAQQYFQQFINIFLFFAGFRSAELGRLVELNDMVEPKSSPPSLVL